jgi:hypothetical protein
LKRIPPPFLARGPLHFLKDRSSIAHCVIQRAGMARLLGITLIASLGVLVSQSQSVIPGQGLFPLPTNVTWGTTHFLISGNAFAFDASSGFSNGLLENAMQRYAAIIFREIIPSTPINIQQVEAEPISLNSLAVTVATSNTTLGLDTDESYNLTIDATGATLSAFNVVSLFSGALFPFSVLCSSYA